MLLQEHAKKAAFSLHKYKCPLWKLSTEIGNLFLKHELQKASKNFLKILLSSQVLELHCVFFPEDVYIFPDDLRNLYVMFCKMKSELIYICFL